MKPPFAGMNWKVRKTDTRCGQAHPEMVIPGAWKVRPSGDRGAVDLTSLDFIAPEGETLSERLVRTHEMAHVAFTPKGKPAELAKEVIGRLPDGLEEALLQVAEDCRVNHLAVRYSFRPDLLEDAQRDTRKTIREKLAESFAVVSGVGATKEAITTFSLLHYFCLLPWCDAKAHALVDAYHGAGPAGVMRKIASGLLADPSFPGTVRTAVALAELFKGDDRRIAEEAIRSRFLGGIPRDGEGEGESEGESDSEGLDGPGAEGRGRDRRLEFVPDFHLPDSVKEALDGVRMDIKYCKMPNRKRVGCGLERRPVELGLVPRYVQRFGWGPMFNEKINSYAGGTVLLDWSGSMSLRDSDVWGLLESAPLATFAYYCAGAYEGNLVICAEKGKYSTLAEMRQYRIGGANVVDLYALQWLARQPKPRVWISDGVVTGRRDNQFASLTKYINKHVLRPFDIRRFSNIDAAQEAFANRKRFRLIRGRANPFEFKEGWQAR